MDFYIFTTIFSDPSMVCFPNDAQLASLLDPVFFVIHPPLIFRWDDAYVSYVSEIELTNNSCINGNNIKLRIVYRRVSSPGVSDLSEQNSAFYSDKEVFIHAK